MEQKYLDALIEAERISKEARTTYKERLAKSGVIWILEEPGLVTIVVFQSGIIMASVSKDQPALFQELLAEIRTRRNDTIRRVDVRVDSKEIPYRPK